VLNTCQAFAPSPPLAPASTEFGLSSLVVNQGSQSEPNRTIKSPPSLDHRYLKEDVGFGLVPMVEIGKLLGAKTPVMDALITLASTALRTDFRTEGLTLEKMGLADATAETLSAILENGFSNSW